MSATHTIAQRLYYDSPVLEFTAHITDIRLVEKDPTRPQTARSSGRSRSTAPPSTPKAAASPGTPACSSPPPPAAHVLKSPSSASTKTSPARSGTPSASPSSKAPRSPVPSMPARRTDHEQQHSGQHLLSAVFLRELGARTVSFHLGAESSTIDLALPEGTDSSPTTDLRLVEETANRIIYENRPLLTHWVERPLAEQMLARGDLRKLPPLEGPFRIVQMQGIEFNACGGTHVRSTGAIGAILAAPHRKSPPGLARRVRLRPPRRPFRPQRLHTPRHRRPHPHHLPRRRPRTSHQNPRRQESSSERDQEAHTGASKKLPEVIAYEIHVPFSSTTTQRPLRFSIATKSPSPHRPQRCSV